MGLVGNHVEKPQMTRLLANGSNCTLQINSALVKSILNEFQNCALEIIAII